MKYTIGLWLCLMITITGSAQQEQSLFIGPGFGFDHGGIGVKAEFQPEKHIGIFGGLGYNLAKVGANAGLIYNMLPAKRVTPVLTAMYGYNAVIEVTYLDGKDYGIYNGLTLGAGADVKLGRSRKSKLNANLLVPLRNSTFFGDYNFLRRNGEISQAMLPIAFSFGWNYNILYRR